MRLLSLDCLIIKVSLYKSCLSPSEIVQKLKANLNLHSCYLDSFFSSALVIWDCFFLLLCIYLKIIIISLPFCLYMSLPLLRNPVPKTGNGTSFTVLASQVKAKGLLIAPAKSVYTMQHDLFLFSFFPSIFF